MPNIKSAIKRVSTTQKKNLRNRMIKSSMRTALKKFSSALAEGQGAVELHTAFSALDKAVTKGVIHKNAANRKKSRLAKHAAHATN